VVLPLQFDDRTASPSITARATDGSSSSAKFPRLQAGPAASNRLTKDPSLYHRYGKRILDASIAVAALALLSPLLALTALLVRWKLGTPVLFRQKRPGRHGVPFEVRKFRTMTDDRDESGRLLPDEHRLPPLGRWLRSTSLDELPELLNVVRGEMSLVGPRPLMMQYLQRYTPEQHRRHEVRPGLTGWSQINGRNALDWDEKFTRDAWYVDHMSLWLDLKILFLTPLTILKREGISAGDHATMPEFLGTQATTASERIDATSSLPKAA
jgi:sugar transferase EpsL